MFGGPTFILAIIAMSMLAWVLTTAIRAKHGYPITDDWGGTVKRGDVDEGRAVKLLASANEELNGKVLRLEERIAVLERIATDPSKRLSDEIERLRIERED